jgi:hypothetical protein
MKSIIAVFGVTIGIIIIIGLAVLLPILYLWALNTLFPVLAIPYSLETWSAAVLLHIFFSKSIEIKKDKQ